MQVPKRAVLAWSLFLAAFGCLAGGLVVTLVVTRPLTAEVLVDGATWLLFATVGLVLTLRRPANPIGWLYAAAGAGVDGVRALGPVGRPAAAHSPPAAAGRPARGPGRRQPLGGRHHPGHHPAAAAAPRRAVAFAPLAVVAAVAGTALTVVGWCLSPEPLTQTLRPIDKPFPLHGVAGTVATTISWMGEAVLFACIPPPPCA